MRQLRLAVAMTVGATTLAVASTTPAVAEVSPNVVQVDIEPTGDNEALGAEVLVLSNGNYLLVDELYDAPNGGPADVGRVTLYDGTDDSVISFIAGSTASDSVGSDGVFEVGNGNVVIATTGWDDDVNGIVDVGAVTWMDGTLGFGPAGSVVSSANSLIGSSAGDGVGANVMVLESGDYVASSGGWDDPATAVVDAGHSTFGTGNAGVAGVVTDANSIVGRDPNAQLGNVAAVEVANGNYVVAAPVAPVTVGATVQVEAGFTTLAAADGTTVGRIAGGDINTVHGLVEFSRVGQDIVPIPESPTGQYVVGSARLSYIDPVLIENAGGFRIMDGDDLATPAVGLDETTAVVGRSTNDGFGQSRGVHAFKDGSVLIRSNSFNGLSPFRPSIGAVARIAPVTASSPFVAFKVDETNSLVGGSTNDGFGYRLVSNPETGTFAVGAPNYDTANGADSGLAVFGSVTQFPTGIATTATSSQIIGSGPGDDIGLHIWVNTSSGLYGTMSILDDVVIAGTNTVDAGTAMFFSENNFPTTPISPDASNALVGTTNDEFLTGWLHPLSNGNSYFVVPGAIQERGIAILIDQNQTQAAQGLIGPISTTMGVHGPPGSVMGFEFIELTDGNAVFASDDYPNTSDRRGAATWLSGTQRESFEVNDSNSVVGGAADDRFGSGASLAAIPGGHWLVVGRRADNPNIAGDDDDGSATLVLGGERRAGTNSANASVFGDSDSTPLNQIQQPFWPDERREVVLTADRGVLFRTNQNRGLLLKLDDFPEFVTPDDVSAVTTGPDDTDVVVTYSTPVATDDRDPSPTVTCVPASGSTFPLGVTQVQCTATDDNTNTATTAFNVTVTANQLPDIVPVVPARLVDTRLGEDTVDGSFEATGRLDAGETYEFQVTGRGGVPIDAVAATLNVVAVRPDDRSYITVHPCDTARPLASGANSNGNDVRANELLAKFDGNGRVCIFTLRPTDLVVDVTSYIPTGSDIVPLTPARLVDTRPNEETADGSFEATGRLDAGETFEFQVAGRGGVPATGVDAAVLNVVAVNPSDRGFFTIHPCDQPRPIASGLNHTLPFEVIANEQVAKLGADGSVCIYTLVDTHLVVDVNGYSRTGSDLVSITPERFVETRADELSVDGVSQGGGPLPGGLTLRFQVTGRGSVPANGVTAATLNVAAINPDALGYFTLYPCDQPQPLASGLNYEAGQVIANEQVAKLDADGAVCLFTLTTTELIVDVTGYVNEVSDAHN